MNWKNIGRVLVCLLLVCCLVVNISPIKAEATAAALIASPVFVPAAIAIGAVLMGLGILAVADNPRFESVVSDCLDSLYEKGFLGDADEIEMYKMVGDDYGQYMISQELAEAVRDYLFDSNVVTEKEVVSSFSTSSLTSTTYYPVSYCLGSMLLSSPENALSLLKDIGVNNDVIIVGIYKVSPYNLYGYYFDSHGIFRMGSFANPLGQVNSSLIGRYSLSDLTLINSGMVPTQYASAFYDAPVFYSREYAEKWDGFLTSTCFALNFDSCPTPSTAYAKLHYFYKERQNSTFNPPSYSVSIYSSLDGFGTAYYPTSNQIIWGTDSNCVVSDGLTAGTIAGQDTTFADGYSTWASGAKALTRPGSDDETIPYIPLGMGKTWEETITMTQAEVQAGTGTYEDTGTGTASDTVTATGLKGWLDTLRMTMASGYSNMIDNAKANASSISQSVVSGVISGIKSLFVPAEGYLDAKIEVLSGKFSFFQSISETGSVIQDFLFNVDPQPPVIYIDLGASTGSYDVGGRVPFVDLTWYEEYKPTVDNILGAFLWLWFAWRMYLSLPGILAGTSGFWGPADSHIGFGNIDDAPARLNPGTQNGTGRLGSSEYHYRAWSSVYRGRGRGRKEKI